MISSKILGVSVIESDIQHLLIDNRLRCCLVQNYAIHSIPIQFHGGSDLQLRTLRRGGRNTWQRNAVLVAKCGGW